MADRKARSLLFTIPPETGLGDIKTAIEEITRENAVTVFQQIGTSHYLVELSDADQAREIIEHGFDYDEHHIDCHPPYGLYLNVSIMGLKAYVDDDAVIEKLSEYGEIKSSVIRLKYKQGHDLAGLENGNRLIRMILTAPSIPYSLRIGDEWCRIIHNNQQLICTHCNEPGHSRKNCPSIECRLCKSFGHLSFHCPNKSTWSEQTSQETDEDPTPSDTDAPMELKTEQEPPTPITTETPFPATPTTEKPAANTDINNASPKRQYPTDSDSETISMPRKQRTKTRPNVNAARRFKPHDDPGTSTTNPSLC